MEVVAEAKYCESQFRRWSKFGHGAARVEGNPDAVAVSSAWLRGVADVLGKLIKANEELEAEKQVAVGQDVSDLVAAIEEGGYITTESDSEDELIELFKEIRDRGCYSAEVRLHTDAFLGLDTDMKFVVESNDPYGYGAGKTLAEAARNYLESIKPVKPDFIDMDGQELRDWLDERGRRTAFRNLDGDWHAGLCATDGYCWVCRFNGPFHSEEAALRDLCNRVWDKLQQ